MDLLTFIKIFFASIGVYLMLMTALNKFPDIYYSFGMSWFCIYLFLEYLTTPGRLK